MIPRVVELQRKPRIYRSSLMRLRKLCAVILRADPRRARSLCILRVIPCCSWREAASRFTWSTRGARVEALRKGKKVHISVLCEAHFVSPCLRIASLDQKLCRAFCGKHKLASKNSPPFSDKYAGSPRPQTARHVIVLEYAEPQVEFKFAPLSAQALASRH